MRVACMVFGISLIVLATMLMSCGLDLTLPLVP